MSSVANTFLGTGSGPTYTSNSGDKVTVPSDLPTSINGPVEGVTGAAVNAVSSTVSYVGSAIFFNSRFAAIILGLICIAGAILLYVGEDIADALGVGSKGAIVKTALGA